MAEATFEQQYNALRNGCGLVELANWSSLTLTGADRQPFLHNFCTNDIKRLKPGESCEAFFTNVKGRILGHGIVSCREGELVVVGIPGQSTTLIEHLDRYLIREDVRLVDTTAERRYVLLAGGEAAQRLFLQYEETGRLASVPATVIRWKLVGSACERVFELPSPDSAALLDAGCGMVPAGNAFHAARIEAGTPLFMVDFDEHNFPQEVGRDRQAISFTKGCYLGQETVARIDALGHVNQRLVGVRFAGADVPTAGLELLRDGAVMGRVTSAALSPHLGAPLALAMLRREANSAGTRLESAAGTCEVVQLPLVETS